jgi:beta-mannosidase
MNKRNFLKTTGTAVAALWLGKPCLSLGQPGQPNSSSPHRIDLNGSWEFAKEGSEQWLPATVPGCVHTDLLAAGKIPDPFFRDNEHDLQWIGEANWTYRRTIQVPADFMQHDAVRLHCAGLDTLATVRLNGVELGKADNMFRLWEYDVKRLLHPGENTIEIAFRSPLPVMREREAQRVLYEWAGPKEPVGRAWVRKEPCNFGWDWAPVLITCGIWRDIGLVAFDSMRLAEVQILQDHLTDGTVQLRVAVKPEIVYFTPFNALITLAHQGQVIDSATVTFTEGAGQAEFVIANPKLWWPAGMGAQPLYEVTVELRNADNTMAERVSKRIGLRTLKLLPPDDRNSLRFEANGVPFFAKGANFVPADTFATRVTSETLRRLVADAVAVNMNSLRFWGGGYYEDDALFDACDELGICVWLDFKFACSSYPAFDTAFMENVRQEAREQLRRLRHHACIAVWCGNNEISLMTKPEWSKESMGRADYDKLFRDLLGSEVQALAPQANYVTGSPDCGDVHFWKVWHGGKTFDEYRTLTGFMSEFGFQSFPDPKTVAAYTSAADRASIMTPVMQWHERSGTNGLDKIRDMIPHYFRAPKDFESALWLSQIVQGMGIQMGAEHWRRSMPKSMGCMFWQYNDCWPVASWSSVDYFGRWKALQFLARRFYAPLLISGLEDASRGEVEIHVTSDRLEKCAGKASWQITDAAGKTLDHGRETIEIPARQSRKVKTLRLSRHLKSAGLHNVLVWLRLETAGEVVSENLVSFVPPKDLPLAAPEIERSVTPAGGDFVVTLTAAKPALWCWLDLHGAEAKYSDNFIHLAAVHPAPIRVSPGKPMSATDFAAALRVRSLFDTAQA